MQLLKRAEDPPFKVVELRVGIRPETDLGLVGQPEIGVLIHHWRYIQGCPFLPLMMVWNFWTDWKVLSISTVCERMC